MQSRSVAAVAMLSPRPGSGCLYPEPVLRLPGLRIRIPIAPVHRGVQRLAVELELDVVIVHRWRVLVQVFGIPRNYIRSGAPTTGDEVHDPLLFEPLVVVRMAADHHNL